MSELGRSVVEAVREAGAAVRGFYKDSYTVKEKGEDNPLTDADIASNNILQAHLTRLLPEAGWLSEESADDASRCQRTDVWIVDPVDGTKEFTLGIPEFVVSVALVREGRPVLGVLYNPIQEQLFVGEVGEGAWYNGVPCRVSSHAPLDGARIVCSRTEMKKGWFDKYLDRLKLMPVGSVAYKFGLVGAGMAEATFTPQPRHEWDIAGGVAFVQAAGGHTSNRHGAAFRFNLPKPLVDGICATNGVIHPHILALMDVGA
jgi:myo-inositol-1(or 4)-monophosphatase